MDSSRNQPIPKSSTKLLLQLTILHWCGWKLFRQLFAFDVVPEKNGMNPTLRSFYHKALVGAYGYEESRLELVRTAFMDPCWNQPVHACLDEPVKNGPDDKAEYFIEAKQPLFANEVNLSTTPVSVTIGLATGTLAAIMILLSQR